ncbi:two-component system response regulator [candidate division KSB3 bacterium]|uniref:Two-component system response regulator n=1 Tax=candidate division KSB3 bacterium TaxID=2044937 RepID=A0A2G6E3V4_9BACT|nr:MAG: two-component system response regulator [candidate division KSB3 bacterium]PIE29154.1 MAG: two-component system response regulator [candidate division KSB3 bacterium]
MTKRILVVDDEKVFSSYLEQILTRKGLESEVAHNGEEALAKCEQSNYDLVISDIKMPKMSGLEFLKAVRERSLKPGNERLAEMGFIIMTAHGSVETAVEAMKLGANDYITKPFNAQEVLLVIEKVFDQKQLQKENQYLQGEVQGKYSVENIISESPRMDRVFELISNVAPTDSTVLVQGETGTGKELVARAVHYISSRKQHRFVAVNCGALTDNLLESELFGHEKGAFTGAIRQKIGKFELADRGTLFLDEIGNVSPAMQMKLLRVLQERHFERVGGTRTIEVDVRIISATNEDLEKSVADGRFREDLYYRINVIPIVLPPLRQRREDIPLLAGHYVEQLSHGRIKEVSDGALHTLMSYDWPGNIRELINIIERSILLERGPVLKSVDLPTRMRRKDERSRLMDFNEELPLEAVREQAIDIVEKEYMIRILQKYRGSIKRTAEHAGLTTRSIHGKMKKFELRKEDYKN